MTASARPIVRTRFAPSPTGYLHLGGARTALFAWAYARHHHGVFVLRIEDTDVARSTPEAVQAILDSMTWLGMAPDEGPFYQMQHMDRYRAVIRKMLQDGSAYPCYSTPAEVETMRQTARERGVKPRYDGTWRPAPGKTLPPAPLDRRPVVRFATPQAGVTQWDDLVKGIISIDNSELDDLIIARQDGTPTYNFCVVIDDWDMRITHVIRGDDHVNNTPRQINILRALGADVPHYAHVPMILGPDGQKLSKRHGAVDVMAYDAQGYLPEAMINYLARLGFSHGNDELFTREQLIQWFDTDHLTKSASQWDPKKLNWVNAHYIKQMDDTVLAKRVAPRITRQGGSPEAVDLPAVVHLLKDRAETLEQLAESALLFCGPARAPDAVLAEQHLTAPARAALADFAKRAATTPWTRQDITVLIKTVLTDHGLKMPQLAIPLRVAVCGQTQTPAIDAVLERLGRETVLQRLAAV
jgi:glutamyl-tRNA synthetase